MALTMMSTAGSNGVNDFFFFPVSVLHSSRNPLSYAQVDKRRFPVPSHPSTGAMLKGFLMRRQSSKVSVGSPTTTKLRFARFHCGRPQLHAIHEPVYGDLAVDAGDEVRFCVELTWLGGLTDRTCTVLISDD